MLKQSMNLKHSLDAETAFIGVQKMLFKIAGDTSKCYGIPYDTCLSECYYAFVKAWNWRWDPSKGTKFSTTVYTIAKWRMRNLVRTRVLAVPLVELTDQLGLEVPPTHHDAKERLQEMVEDLSDTAREIVELLLETPADLIQGGLRSEKLLLQRIKRHLKNHGRGKEELEAAHVELNEHFQEAWA